MKKWFLIFPIVWFAACHDQVCDPPSLSHITVEYKEVSGIGYEAGCTRRDPSDIIKVQDTFYVYYTKVFGVSPGYWGTVWAAYSTDEGRHWTEIGEVLGTGKPDAFDHQATFTPNILPFKNKYYLYYTGVQPTRGRTDGVFENNSTNDFTAIGVALSDHPAGPFKRISDQPVLSVSATDTAFDSYRVDDAVMLVRNKEIWMYFKGRSLAHGQVGPRSTQMGVAFATSPEGPFEKYDQNPILAKSHEVLAWPHGPGVACLASFSSTFEYASDGLDFKTNPLNLGLKNRPLAPGLFRPDLMTSTRCGEMPEWGISMVMNGPECYLRRFAYICSSTSKTE